MERDTKDNKRQPADQTESGWIPTGAAGILGYRREPGLATSCVHAVHGSSAEAPAHCEYCGRDAEPLLELSWEQWPERPPTFCCIQRQQLYELLAEDRCAAGGRCVATLAAEMDDPEQLDTDWDSGFEPSKSKELLFEDVLRGASVVAAGSSRALSFRLSRAPDRCWTSDPGRTEKELLSGPPLDHEPLKFGLCDHQAASDFAQKNYSSGTRLLTTFSDGSAQLFYPSGSLAIVVMVTEDNGKVCMVYDDSSAAAGSPRAIFHSDGRATCYHGNRNVWLNVNGSTGRCSEQDGTRTRQWTWSGSGRTPSALDPLRLSLNQRIEVQILGQEQAFISFQACGEEVKLRVGRCSS